MQFTEPQANIAILAIVRALRPDFDHLPEPEKTSMGQGTWTWFGPLLDRLPEDISVDGFMDSWDTVQNVASEYLAAAAQAGAVQADSQDEADALARDPELVTEQTKFFMRLGTVGVEAIVGQRELMAMVNNFDSIDINAELAALIDSDG